VTIDRAQGIVVKRVHKYLHFDIVRREADWLRRLADCGWVPRLLDAQDSTLTLSYVGERATKDTVPDQWEEQVRELLADLRRHECCHNDIKPRDILVFHGELRLIDFGWATPLGAPVPADWPPRLGADWKAPHGFDDAYSIRKSILTILS
jgi:serine/threonine protein kinase